MCVLCFYSMFLYYANLQKCVKPICILVKSADVNSLCSDGIWFRQCHVYAMRFLGWRILMIGE